jgi:hypothetical protein
MIVKTPHNTNFTSILAGRFSISVSTSFVGSSKAHAPARFVPGRRH